MKKSLLAAAIALLQFCCSVAFSLDPMGSSAGTLRRGQFGAGADYSFTDVDFKAKGRSTLKAYNVNSGDIIGIQFQEQSLSLDGVEVQRVYADLGYGITDNLEAFLRLGAADVQWKNDSDTHFSFGLRSGVSLYQKGALLLNALAQYSWAESHFHSVPLTTVIGSTSYPMLMSGKLNTQELQIALGPTYELSKGISLYGGGFLHFLDGKLDLKGSTSAPGLPMIGYDLDSSYDIARISELGAYIGAKVDATKDISFSIEYQHTASADTIALRLIWKS